MSKLIIGGLTVKSLPSDPMTKRELKAQCKMVQDATKALDHFTEDELEFYVDELNKRRKDRKP